jgi:hypothetical protein
MLILVTSAERTKRISFLDYRLTYIAVKSLELCGLEQRIKDHGIVADKL